MNALFKNSLVIFLLFTVFDLYSGFVDNERVSAYAGLLTITISWTFILVGVLKYSLVNQRNLLLFDKTVLFIFFWICLINIIRSINIPLNVPQSFPRYLGGNLYAAAWLVPFFVLYGTTIQIWRDAWKISLVFTKIFVFLSPLYLYFFTRNSFFYSNIIKLVFFIPVLLINWHLIEKKYRKFVIAAFVITSVFSLYYSERHLLARLIFYPVAYYLFIFFNNVENRLSNFKKLTFFLVGIGFCFFLLYSGVLSQFVSDPNTKENLETYEKGNLNADSRKMVYEDFNEDFTQPEDWLFGRGVLGTTFSEQFITIQIVRGTEENVFNLPIGYRTEVEGGYLMYVLKVGLVGLISMLVLCFRAISLALFQSNNYFVKACAFIIIEWLISMYPYGVPEYNFSYILFWLCIGTCLSVEMRAYTNEEINGFFLNTDDVSILPNVKII
jgi:hypothetical protein